MVKVERQVYERLQDYSWPGNVRELENTVQRMLVLTDEEVIGVNHIAFRVDDAQAAHDALHAAGVESVEQPGYVASTGRTNVNLRDPDGWRMQLVASDRKAPAEGPH